MKQGMPEGLVGEVTTALAAYEHAVDNKSTGRSAHVGASADLLAVTDRIMQLIQQLDALNRLRFRDDPEMLAAWRSAHDIDWPHPAKQDSVPRIEWSDASGMNGRRSGGGGGGRQETGNTHAGPVSLAPVLSPTRDGNGVERRLVHALARQRF